MGNDNLMHMETHAMRLCIQSSVETRGMRLPSKNLETEPRFIYVIAGVTMPRKLDVGAKVELLRQFHRRENRIPGYAEMLKLFGYRSKNAVFLLIQKLVDYGYLYKGPRGQTLFTDKLV